MLDLRVNKYANRVQVQRRKIHQYKFSQLKRNKIYNLVGKQCLIKMSNEWSVNLSSKNFNEVELSVLSLDPKFQPTLKCVNKEQIVAKIESKLKYLVNDNSKIADIRISLINSLNSYDQPKSNLTREQWQAIKKLKNDKDILITQADKGNKTVILNKIDYVDKVLDILSDTYVYESVSQDKTNYLANKLVQILKSYHKNNYITYNEYLWIYPDNYSIPYVYALIKIHKENNPARLIFPYFTYPLCKIAKFIQDIIAPSIRNSSYLLLDSIKFVQDIKSLIISRNDLMISLDIVNLFTNIPIETTLNIIREKLESDVSLTTRTNLPISEIISMVKFIMENNYFKFDEKIYKQKTGAPMGCNLSPVLGDALVSRIFEQAISGFKYKNNLKICRYYVDDSFIIINSRYVDSFYNYINDIGKSLGNIKFTIEKESNNSLSFLDVKLTRFDNKIETSVYRKPTHSSRYLNFKSHSSLQNKIGVINNLITRSFKISSKQESIDDDVNFVHKSLQLNNFPENFISSHINKRLTKLNNNSINSHDDIDLSKVICIPYYKGLSEEISGMLRDYDIKVVYKRGNNIGNILTCKYRKSIFENNQVVYNLECNDCPYVYSGQTGRSIKARLSEHKNALNYSYLNSNVADHAINFKHNIKFDKPLIKYKESSYSARRFLESFDIEKLKKNKTPLMNDQQNSTCIIPSVYLSLLK